MHSNTQEISKDYWLVTGSTGLIGEYLLKDMLQAGFKIAVVVRASKSQSARQRIEGILQRWESELGTVLPRPVILEGDITQPGFDLAADQLEWINRFCGHILHNAAILKFFGPCRSSEPWTTNVGGTCNAIKLAQDCGIEDFHYVSTAYVCGDRTDRISEEEFDRQQGFRNDYEHSKFEAEKLVRSAGFAKPPTVYRPVVVSGDSQTGYTSTYHGLYLYLRMIALLVPQQERDAAGKIVTRIDLPMTGDEPRNIVPVDWVAEVLTHLIGTPKAHGRTFHIAPQDGITANQLVQFCYDYFGSTGVNFCGRAALDRQSDNDFASKVFDAIKIYEDYETSDPVFDRSNLEKFAGHLDCPALDRNIIHRYIDFGESDRWGRKKKKAAEWSLCGEALILRLADEILDLATDLQADAHDQTSDFRFRCTFDLLGPGGGVWSVEAHRDGQVLVTPGALPHPDLTLQMNVQRLEQWLSSDRVARRQVTARWVQRTDGAHNIFLTD